MPRVDTHRSEPELSVDWAPAYDLLLSLIAFSTLRKHPNLELGQAWLRRVRQLLPPDFVAPGSLKSDDECFPLLLVYACPGPRDPKGFLDWLAQLSPGGMYDALCDYLPEGRGLPRDFLPWRDRFVDGLRVWNERYFSTVDPAIFDGLRANADQLQARIGTAAPVELVEETTNGLLWESAPELRRIVLVPQYHERPYNSEVFMHDGVVLFYPADVLPPPADAPPTGLLRLTRGLGDESRLRILRFLTNGPCTQTEVARFAGLSQPTVHHHLTQLRVAGLVRVHCSLSGPNRYSLRPRCVDDVADQLTAYLEPATGGSR
jgi:DNA-binding transcriptional ArsR family regulator